jgi:hypothetical protein
MNGIDLNLLLGRGSIKLAPWPMNQRWRRLWSGEKLNIVKLRSDAFPVQRPQNSNFMISNSNHSPYDLRQRPLQEPQGSAQPKMRMPEDIIAVKEFRAERKSVRLMLKENARGRFLRITETAGGKVDGVIIPESGLGELAKALEEIIQAAKENPPAKE